VRILNCEILGTYRVWNTNRTRKGETAKRTTAARTNSKKAASAAKKKRTIAHLPKSIRTALGKKGAQAAKRKRAAK
jgi:hypothetical protein